MDYCCPTRQFGNLHPLALAIAMEALIPFPIIPSATFPFVIFDFDPHS
jgi:hypothetical protein